ncbi:MAG TPA: ACT domain-containing protein [Rhizomicrobium sp.]|jgi:acetolactate synthase-1/3 small subunit
MKTIHIELDRTEGSLQRLIGLIERRGFHIDDMTMTGNGDYRRVAVKVRPRDAHRHGDVLDRQIDRMFGASRMTHEEAVSCVA